MIFVAVLCSVLFGLSFLGTKVALDGLSPIQLMAGRWTVALVVFLILIAAGKIKIALKGKPIKYLVLLAIFQPCIYAATETWGINLTTLAESSILLAFIPVVVTGASIFIFKERVDGVTLGAILLAFLGVVITMAFSGEGSEGGHFLGYVLLMITVLCGAAYTILSGRLSRVFSPMEITFVMVLLGSICFNGAAFIMGEGVSAYTTLFTRPSTALAVVYLGLICSICCYSMMNYVFAHLPAHKASSLTMNIITLTGVLSGLLFRGESLHWNTGVGMILILMGVIGANRK
ncbi:MAG: DMT family transporter [Anaerovoracaceae bacterium]